MGFRRSDLQEAFFVPGTHPFRVWGYGTTDPLEDLLGPDYFRAAGGLMQPGDLIYVSVRPRGERGNGPETGETRMALVMVRAGERGAASVRLVQDFGRPDDPDAAMLDPRAPATTAVPEADAPPSAGAALSPAAIAGAPVVPKRGRGRPPGSRTRKPRSISAKDGNSSRAFAPPPASPEISGA